MTFDLRPLFPYLLQHLKTAHTHLSTFLLSSKSFLSSPLQNQTPKPPHTQFLLLLRHCNTVEALSKTHTHLIVNGYIEDQHLAVETIQRYLSFNLPKLALSVYHSTHKPTLLLQNLVIRCLSDHGYYTDLLSLYFCLRNSGSHRSDNFTFPFVIKACAALPSLRTGKEVHCVVLRTGYNRNVVVQTALVDMYAKTGQMDCLKKVFDEISHRDLISWNALISGCALNGYNREAFKAFRMMQAADSLKPTVSTFVSLIPLGGLRVGRSLHGFALKSGAFGDETLMSSLISMYAGLEDLAAARKLFEIIEDKDLVSWNAMVSAYSQNGRPEEAFGIFCLMHHEDVRPNFVTMVSVIQSCGDLSSPRCGESVHANGMKFGLTEQISVVTSLVSMYAKLRDLDATRHLFYTSPERNLLLYNSMISAYLLNGPLDMGLTLFRHMQLEGLIPDAISIISVISGCSMSKDLNSGKSAHAYSLRKGFDSNTSVMNALLSFYFACNRFADTLKLFHRMQERNVISFNTSISGWAKIGDTEASIASFCQMREEDIEFDLITMISILPCFYRPEDFALGVSFHALVIKIGFESDISLKNALITMYTNCGDVEAGCLLFESLSFRTIVSWNAMMTGYRNHSLFKEVMVLFDRMKRNIHKPNSITLLNLLPSCETKLQGKSIHAFTIRNLVELEPSLLTSTMCMYARFENFTSCHLLFKTMDKKNVVSWNTMMSVYARSKDVGKAVTSFKEMLAMGLEPDIVTMLVLASACSQLDSQLLAQCVTSFVVRKGFDNSTAVINALIDMNARCSSSSFARELFDGLKAKDSITWSTMINAYGMHGDGEAAVGLFYEMQEAGVEPDGVTFVSILSACSHAGLVEQGRIVFESMADVHRIEPRFEHYACMVDLLGRTGHLGEAYELVRRLLPLNKPCARLLESLLGACRSHGDAKVGRAVGELVMELYPWSATSYVMLSNVYSSAERWTDAGRLRCDMDERGLKKDPGFSLCST